MRRLALPLIAIGFLLIFPWIPFIPLSVVVNANLAGEFAVVAMSLVILTGWVGQISLGQGSFVGIGAFATGLIVRQMHLAFPLDLLFVTIITGSAAALLGVVALRVRGLYLAVATLIFAWMADAYLFSARWFVGTAGASSIPNAIVGRRGTVTSFDLSQKRVFYYVVLATVAAVWYVAQNLRGSKTGRAFLAIRGSEMAAVSLGIDVARYKLLAFALSGAIAGIAGNLIMTDLRTATPVSFQFTWSLFVLAIAVVGGITSLGGAIAASVLFAGLNELFFRVPALSGWLDIVSVGLLLAVLLGYPGGLGALGSQLARLTSRLSRSMSARMSSRSPKPAAERVRGPRVPLKIPVLGVISRALGELARALRKRRRSTVAPNSLDFSKLKLPTEIADEAGDVVTQESERVMDWRDAPHEFVLPEARDDRRRVLEAAAVTVRFGGLTAVDDVSLVVREHEITGLIGPNGAGKTTLFNAISGLNEPVSGRISLFDQDVTRMPVHVRAQLGIGRTFQLIQLFPQLTVFENLLVATHNDNETGVFSHLLLTADAMETEAGVREQVHVVIRLLGLDDVADSLVAGLPFGILRQVEIARALVTRSPLLMLDEPASGLDNSETDTLASLLRFLRGSLGVTILLIEHDVRLVTSVSDYIYVLDRGQLLAEGTAAEIQENPLVVAAYLGEPLETAGV